MKKTIDIFFVALSLCFGPMLFAQADSLEKSTEIEQLVITGVTDIAKDRKTPVAATTVKEAKIVERLGNQEFPEILNTTPSVYVTKTGGFGASEIKIRGFGNQNIAVMINGIPVNDMENGTVYWSNWAGLSDVTSSMQIQRGLGSSKLAISSVGGTINILTRAADKKREGNVTVSMGNNGYLKTLFSYNTGKNEKGWSTSILMARTAGAMYVDGTDFEGYNYYLALGYRPTNKKHDFQFTFTGAPQWHMNSYQSTISDYMKYGENGKPNRRYNPSWGYLNGKKYSRYNNFYSKPIASFNWDWNMSSQSKLSTVAYASWGRGGGTNTNGKINGKTLDQLPRTSDGLIRYDDIFAWNQGQIIPDFTNNSGIAIANNTPGIASSNNGIVGGANLNAHDWYGLLTNFQHKINEELNFSVGVDTRYYYAYRPGAIYDLLGNSRYIEKGDANRPDGYPVTNTIEARPSANPFVSPLKDNSKIAYRNINGEVFWYGGFGQLEYSKNNFTVFTQGAISNQGVQRINNWVIDGITEQQGKKVNRKTGFKNVLGYNIKGGGNYNINERNNVFANIGYYSRQPYAAAIYPNNQQILNPNLTNEKVFSIEAGYGYRSPRLKIHLNAYRTMWKDRFQRKSGLDVTDNSGNLYSNAFAEVSGITQLHYGAEIEALYKLHKKIELEGMVSLGNWKYVGNSTGTIYDQNYHPINVRENNNVTRLALDGVRVENAPQFTTSFTLNIKPVNRFKVFANWRYVDLLYANYNINDFDISQNTTTYTSPGSEYGALRLPGYNLFDLGISYRFKIGSGESIILGANVYNILDTEYISKSMTNIQSNLTRKNFRTDTEYQNYLNVPLYKGIKQSNSVYFGFGRTWATSVSFRF
ncbi:MAG: TonB-dependent receptor [Bergeyella sp.]|nr:TonB-dependent receptor [Bergeyella sp.]